MLVALESRVQSDAAQDRVAYLQHTLALHWKDEIKRMPIKSGAAFLGDLIYPHYLRVRKRVLASFYQALRHGKQQYISGARMTLTKQSTEQLQSCVASYLRHLNHAKSSKIIHKLRGHFP